ncbi:MAG: SUMF1/EgtB/PvdO family nonheme iron enzyme, partial [Chloroflexota bacterium]
DFPKEYQPQPMDEQEYKYDNHPRDKVSWYQAVAFTRWLTAKYRAVGLLKEGEEIRLPTEEEWEYAARGTDERKYPYPGEYDATKCNTGDTNIDMTSAVGCFPDGASPFGVLDMSGNTDEWCLNEYRNPSVININDSTNSRVLRGGAFDIISNDAASAFRDSYNRSYSGFRSGCRVVLSPPIRASDL